MKLSVTTNQGEVIAVLTDDDVGNLEKTLARSDLIAQLAPAIAAARKKDRVNAIDCPMCGRTTHTYKSGVNKTCIARHNDETGAQCPGSCTAVSDDSCND